MPRANKPTTRQESTHTAGGCLFQQTGQPSPRKPKNTQKSNSVPVFVGIGEPGPTETAYAARRDGIV
jgi:hypothetical protein